MRLRNKKTGEVIILIDHTFDNYNSLADFIEEWEDAPAEPLIKDEKIRKAVRAWAEANGNKVFEVQVSYQSYGDGSWSLRETTSEEDCGLAFIGEIPGELDLGSRYTIDELCGEEEE